MADSLVIDGLIELLGGGVVSALPQCAGATFYLAPGYDLNAPQPQTDTVGRLLLDGEIPIGTRAGNRVITLPVIIKAPDRYTLAAAREILLNAIDAPAWTLAWTRDGGLPLLFDCFRANATNVTYSLLTERGLIARLEISFQALPYGHSDTAEQLQFDAPSSSVTLPATPVTLDDYSTVLSQYEAARWARSTTVATGTYAARWDRSRANEDDNIFIPKYDHILASALDITGLTFLTFWSGLGDEWADSGYHDYLTYSAVLKDAGGHSLSFGVTVNSNISANKDRPAWNKISIPIPQGNAGFDYTHVARYSISALNSWHGYLSAEWFLNKLVAAPATNSYTPASARGNVLTLTALGTARAPLNVLAQPGLVSVPQTVTYSTAGKYTWYPPAGVTSAVVQCWGGGGAGAKLTGAGTGGGGAGGSFAKANAYAVTEGQPIAVKVGAAGVTGTGGATESYFDAVDGGLATAGVWAASGVTALTSSGAIAKDASQSAGDVIHTGGSGASGGAYGGGGGGSSAGTAANGATATVNAGGTAPAGGGNGGAGGASGGNNVGTAGTAPGGAGGGACSTGSTVNGGAGTAGKVQIDYTLTLQPFKTLIAHRPGTDAPATLVPLLPVGNGADAPDGREYTIASPVDGVNARYGGTYTVIAVNYSWNSSGSSRTLTAAFKEYEYPGGASASVSVARTFTPSADISNGLVVIGEITLPVRDIAADNSAAYYTVGLTDTNASDRFLDVLLLDTAGQTVCVNVDSGSGYVRYYLDEPENDRDLGRVLGSTFNRQQAVSVYGFVDFISGGPLTVDPGDNQLLVYSVEGQPSVTANYKPRYFIDRI